MAHTVNSRRNRFYKKIYIAANSIPSNESVWKNLSVFDSDGVTEISNCLEFPTNLTTIVIINDSIDRSCEYSFDGRNLDGELFCDDGPFSQDCTSEGYIYLRFAAGTVLDPDEKAQIRIWAWRGGTGR